MSKRVLLACSLVLLAGCSAATEPAPSDETAEMDPMSVDDWAKGMNEASDRMTANAPPRITDEEIAARRAETASEDEPAFGEPMDDAAGGDDWAE